MSGTKPKQQKSLLSFFSPPASGTSSKKATPSSSASTAANGSDTKRASANTKSAKRTTALASNTTTTNNNSGSAKKRPVPTDIDDNDSAPRKRIEFSPKLKKPSNDDDNDDPMAPARTASPVASQRKAYEDFLGTSSEGEGDSDANVTNKTVHSTTAIVSTNALSLTSKRSRPVKMIVNDDDSDSDNDALPLPPVVSQSLPEATEAQQTSQSGRTRRRITRNVVSSDDDDEDEGLWAPTSSSKTKAKELDDGDESSFSDDNDEVSDEDEDDDEDEDEDEEDEEAPVPNRRKPTRATKQKPPTPAKRTSNASFLSPPPSSKKPASTPSSSTKKAPAAATSNDTTTTNSATGAGTHLHNSLPFLYPPARRDINGNAPSSSDYDPRTLFIPPSFLKSETPAMVQWWHVKAHNMDTILFFKVGKFYELFHMDADVGFAELGLIYMKGDKAHSGFPETAYAKMSSQLVAKGYRVARVEQTETPDMLKQRNATSKSKDKVVRREICSLLSIGTHTNSFLDAPIAAAERSVSRKLLALKEVLVSNTIGGATGSRTPRFGVCMVDCATGAFHVAEFDDTEQRDRLQTLCAQFHIVEVVTERLGLSDATRQVLRHAAASAIRSELRVGYEFWDASRTIHEIETAGYFADGAGWPDAVLACLEVDKTVKADSQLAISALGGCIWHLRRSIIDQELLSLQNFTRYKPSDEEARDQQRTANQALTSAKAELAQHYVVLDAQTLQNLEILTNSVNGSRSGSLVDLLDKTTTAFGKRLFQDWVVKPLCHVTAINERLDAVEALGQQYELVADVRSYLRKLPDLERLLSRIHAIGSIHRASEHPDSRAIMYESKTYNIRKIRDFVAVLDGFGVALEIVQTYGPRFRQLAASPLVQAILTIRSSTVDDDATGSLDDAASQSGGHFPDLRAKLAFFKRSFDPSIAKTTGVIVPPDGVDAEFDDAVAAIAHIEQELQSYLSEQRQSLKCKTIVYWGAKKDDRFQLEVPEAAVSVRQPPEYELKSRKKGYKRFHTPTIRALVAQLTAAEARKDLALRDQMRRVFHRFDVDYKYWMKAVECLATLDCLLSLAVVSSQSDGFTRPQVVSAAVANNGVPFIDIQDGVHPCVAQTFDGDFIPNDTQLGVCRSEDNDRSATRTAQMLLLSGPNMGGKSTLLRQTCVLALMAQIGCFVPARVCRLSPVDRVFTRIGASDRILAGQSTLYVELSETATILHHATRHSLVILDELGRGTSTFDGTAIAYAVVEHLLHDVQCRSLFATHYHSLVEEYADEASATSSLVTLGHMGCIVDPTNDRKVTFLYKLESGMCPKSYGLNVAMLAKLPDEVIELAARKSAQFERTLQQKIADHEAADAAALVRTVQYLLQQPSVDMDKLTAAWTQLQRMQKKPQQAIGSA